MPPVLPAPAVTPSPSTRPTVRPPSTRPTVRPEASIDPPQDWTETQGVGTRTLPYDPEIWNQEEDEDNDEDILCDLDELGWGIEYSQYEVREMEKAEHVNRRRIVARQMWVGMIGREIVVRNGGDLLTIWKVRDNVTEEECPDMDIYTQDAGLKGFNLKKMVISPSRSSNRAYNNASSSSEEDDATGYHSRISPLDKDKVRKHAKKRKRENIDPKINIDEEAEASAKHLKLLQLLYPGDWRDHMRKINAQIMRKNDEIVSSSFVCYLLFYSLTHLIFLFLLRLNHGKAEGD